MYPGRPWKGIRIASENGCKDRKIEHRFRFSIQKRLGLQRCVIEFGDFASRENLVRRFKHGTKTKHPLWHLSMAGRQSCAIKAILIKALQGRDYEHQYPSQKISRYATINGDEINNPSKRSRKPP
jgi:hypothetical protein